MPTLDEQIVLAISADITNLRRAVVQMGGVIKDMAEAMDKGFAGVGNSADRSADKVIRASKKQRDGVVRNAEDAAAAAIAANTKAANYAANNARNLSFQINDVISGLATGGGIRAVSQQFGQIAQSFAGTSVRSTLLGLLSTGNLLTIALTAAGGAAAYFFGTTSEGAKKASDEIEKMRSILNDFGDLIPEGQRGILDRALGEMDIGNALSGLKKVRDAFRDLAGQAILDIKLPSLEGIGRSLESYDALKTVEQLQVSWKGLIDAIAAGEDPTAKVNELLLQLDGIELIAPGVGAEQLAQILRDKVIPLLAKAEDREKAIKALLEAIGATSPELVEKQKKYNAALEEMQKIAVPALTDMEKLARAFAEAMRNAAAATGELTAAEAAAADAAARIGQASLSDMAKSTEDFIKAKEQFRAQAYWDVNHYRVGFGSDTYIDANNTVRKVAKDTVVTLDQANADIERRIIEFQQKIGRQIGGDLFASMSEDQKTALTDIAYNYGELPERIVRAIKTGDNGKVAQAIKDLGGDNAGINRARREEEAALYARGSATSEAGLAVSNLTDAQKAENDQTRERLKLSGDLTPALDKETYERVYAAELSEKMAKAEQDARERGYPLAQKEIDLIKEKAAETAKLAAQEEGSKKNKENEKDIDKRIMSMQDENAELEHKAELLGTTLEALEANLTAEERAAALREGSSAALQIENDYKEKGIQLTEAQTKAIEDQAQATALGKAGLKSFDDTTKESQKSMEQFNEQMASVFKSAISGFISDLRAGKSAAEAFSNMLDRVIDGLINMALEMLFSKNALGGLFGGGFGGGGAPAFSFAEQGGVVGRPGAKRKGDPRWFIGAPSFATGGMVLPHGVVPVLAHQGETILPKGVGVGGDVTNNIGDINVDMAGTGLVTGSSEQGKLLGRQIQAAVQVVLVQESRPGGILRKQPGAR